MITAPSSELLRKIPSIRPAQWAIAIITTRQVYSGRNTAVKGCLFNNADVPFAGFAYSMAKTLLTAGKVSVMTKLAKQVHSQVYPHIH